MLLTCLVVFLVCPYDVVYDKDVLALKPSIFPALEIYVTVSSSVCLNRISTYGIFGYRQVSEFQRH